MKRKIKTILPVGILAMLIFTACGSDGETESSSDEGTEVSSNLPDGPLAKYEEPITITIGQEVSSILEFEDGDNFEDNIYTRFIKDELNINVVPEWQAQAGTDFDQKLNLSIASNDLPDAVVVREVPFRAMIKSDMLADLSGSFETYSSDTMQSIFDTKNGEAEANVTVDGSMYALPTVAVEDDAYNLVWVRKDWLDELGLEPPETRDDVAEIAKAFIDNDMSGTGNTLGFAGPANGGRMYNDFLSPVNNTYVFDALFGTFDAYPGFWLEDENGESTYGSIEPETREALEYLSNMYADGLIDPQIGVRKDTGEIIVAGDTGIFGGVWWNGYSPFPEALANDSDASWQAYMLSDDDGGYSSKFGAVSDQYAVVSKDYEHPEAVILMNNLLLEHTSEFQDQVITPNDIWPLRVALAMADESQFTLDAMEKVYNGQATVEDFTGPEYKSYKLLGKDVETVTDIKLDPYDNLDIEYWDTEGENFQRLYSLMVGTKPFNEDHVDNIERINSTTYSQTETMEKKWANLKKMEDEIFLKIVTGAEPIEAWDQFVVDWKAQGGDEITTEVNELDN